MRRSDSRPFGWGDLLVRDTVQIDPSRNPGEAQRRERKADDRMGLRDNTDTQWRAHVNGTDQQCCERRCQKTSLEDGLHFDSCGISVRTGRATRPPEN